MLLLVPVKFTVVPPSVVTVQQGQNIKLQCLATGYPSPIITWSRIDGALESGKVNANGSLVLENVKKGDSGQYMCTAKNALGKKTYSFSVDMQLKDKGKIISNRTLNKDKHLPTASDPGIFERGDSSLAVIYSITNFLFSNKIIKLLNTLIGKEGIETP